MRQQDPRHPRIFRKNQIGSRQSGQRPQGYVAQVTDGGCHYMQTGCNRFGLCLQAENGIGGGQRGAV